MFEVIFKKAHL